MTVEPLSVYLRRVKGHPELSWDAIADEVEKLEREAAALRTLQALLHPKAGSVAAHRETR